MKERVGRMEEALAQLLGQKLDQLAVGEQAGSQYQSAEQLIDHNQSISHQVSAIMEQHRGLLEDEEEDLKQRDPFNIPEEDEFFIARQSFRTTPNQS